MAAQNWCLKTKNRLNFEAWLGHGIKMLLCSWGDAKDLLFKHGAVVVQWFALCMLCMFVTLFQQWIKP
jgi:hypothetical protein